MTERVLKHSRARGAARNVLHVIAAHADKDGGSAYPSIATIAREANVSRRDVFRSLRRLRDLGEITINLRGDGRAHGTPNQYTMTLAASIGDTTSPMDGEISQNRGDTTSPIDAEIVTSQVTPRHLTGDKVSRKPSSNASSSSSEKSSEKKAAQAQREGTTEERGTGMPASRRAQGTTARAITVVGLTKADVDDVVDAYLAAGGSTSEYHRFKVGKEAELLLREDVDRATLLEAVRLLATTKREPWELRQLVVRAEVAQL